MAFKEWRKNLVKEKTVQENIKSLGTLRQRGANLYECSSVWFTLKTAKKFKNPNENLDVGTKRNALNAYLEFARFIGLNIP